jgi:hypothetical protein
MPAILYYYMFLSNTSDLVDWTPLFGWKFDHFSLRFECLTAMSIKIVVLWVMSPFRFVGSYQSIGVTYCFLFHGNVSYLEGGDSNSLANVGNNLSIHEKVNLSLCLIN